MYTKASDDLSQKNFSGTAKNFFKRGADVIY